MSMILNRTRSGLVRGAMALDGHRICSFVALVALCTPAVLARDADNANPYAVIIVRNAFRSSPPPPPPAPPQPPAPDLPKVIFSGTRKKGSQWFAMFAYKAKDAQKKETTTYISLAEGETSGPVQLVKINPNGEEVEILNTGVHVVLNMKDNGFTNPGVPAAAGAPGPWPMERRCRFRAGRRTASRSRRKGLKKSSRPAAKSWS